MKKYVTVLSLIFWKNMKGISPVILSISCCSQSQHNSTIHDKHQQKNWLYHFFPFPGSTRTYLSPDNTEVMDCECHPFNF